MSSCGNICTVPGTNGFIHSPPIHTDKVNYHLSPTPSMTLISLRLALGLPVYILNLQPLPFTHMTYINDVHGIHAVACNGKGFQHQSSWLSLHNLLHSFIIGVKRKRREKYHIYISEMMILNENFTQYLIKVETQSRERACVYSNMNT